MKREHETTEVPEGRYFYVKVELEGDYLSGTNLISPLVITADLNSNNALDPGEEQAFTEWRGYAAFYVIDDGRGPVGNGSTQDNIEVRATFEGDVETKTIAAINVAPTIFRPSFAYAYSGGQTTVTLTAFFIDPGINDYKNGTNDAGNPVSTTSIAKVTWGDGSFSTSSDFTYNTCACGEDQGHSVSFVKVFNAGGQLLPLTVEVKDDDTSVGTYRLQKTTIARNSDDDDLNLNEDVLDSGFTDDDVLPFDLTSLLSPEMNSNGHYFLSYDLSTVRIWTTQQKTTLISPWNAPNSFDSIPYTGQSSVFIEGVGIGTTSVSVAWSKNPMRNTCDIITLGEIAVQVIGIDLDIDSDNNNGLMRPSRDDKEEFLEANEFAIGKMIYTDATEFTPLVLHVQQGIDTNNWLNNVKFEDLLASTASSGTVQLWKKAKNDSTRTNADKLQFGMYYALPGLGYDAANGEITLYIESLSWTEANRTKVDVNGAERDNVSKIGPIIGVGKTDNRLKATLKVDGVESSDTVKWMIVGPESLQTFYPTLQHSRALRSAGAAKAAYKPESNKDFTLKMLNEQDIRKLLKGRTSEDKINQLVANLGGSRGPGTEPPVPDLTIRLYLDHVSLGYILSFKGTDFPKFDDWVANIQNNISGNADQYRRAMHVAYLLNEAGISFINTGHSLGGGLATAASMATGTLADTFNSAGLNMDTLYENNYWTEDPDVPYYPVTPLAIAAQNFLITAYQVWDIRPSVDFPDPSEGKDFADARDILTEIQMLGSQYKWEEGTPLAGTPLAFEAWGTKIKIEGMLNVNELEYTALSDMEEAVEKFFVDHNWGWAAYYLAWAAILKGEIIEKMTESHSFNSIYFGLLHDLDGWNSYDRLPHEF